MTKKDIPKLLEEIGEEQGFEVGGALNMKEFFELINKMKKDTDNGKDWDKSQKSMADFYQEKNRKTKSNIGEVKK